MTNTNYFTLAVKHKLFSDWSLLSKNISELVLTQSSLNRISVRIK